MNNTMMERRRALLMEFLLEMKEADRRLTALITDIEELSEQYYSDALQESHDDLQEAINKFKSNSSRLNDINNEKNAGMNRFSEYVNDTGAAAKLTYPLLFHLGKRKLKKLFNTLNGEISAITIENRFIREKLSLLGQQLEIKAMQKIREDALYEEYETLVRKKDMLAEELMYLLPTIPGMCPAIIDSRGVEALLDKAKKLSQ